jgi:CRISPR-associated endonuclease/helicase Cas3
MSVLWDAPITVTTAVQFFETLAGSHPARLRKLHELAGAAIFIDEAHAAIPVRLWPQTWRWLKELANDWGCHFVLASGTLAKFWENPDIVQPPEHIPDLLRAETRAGLAHTEKRRIEIRNHPPALGCGELADFVTEKPGPRLVILNTVQNAAVLADFLRNKGLRNKGEDVLHLSTALTPEDRGRVVQRVKERLRYSKLAKWTLVATSCVEAGMDFSFRSAVRECCSVSSLVQTGGRVNRDGDWAGAEVWNVSLQDPMFNQHPGFEGSRHVLREMLENGGIVAADGAVITGALRREFVVRDIRSKAEELMRREAGEEFPEVAKLYRVIESETVTVVVDPELVEALEDWERVPWRDLVRGSVQIWRKSLDRLPVSHVRNSEELYYWTGAYDPDFLGYMASVIPLIEGRDTGYYV